MSYEERVQEFWSATEALDIDSYQIALGLALLELWRRQGCPVSCAISNEDIARLSHLSVRGVQKIRKSFESHAERHKIYCKTGTGRTRPVYWFDDAAVPDEVKQAATEKPKEKPKKKPKPKEKTKPKQKTKVVEPSLPLDFGKEKKRSRSRAKDVETPSRDDVLEICRQKGMSEDDATYFFDYYDAQGWVTSSGQKIKRVDSMVNRWLMKQKEKENGSGSNTNSAKRAQRNEEVARDILSHYKD